MNGNPNTLQIELAVVNYFNPRMNIIVPNIWWGIGLKYEADLVVLRPSGFAIEIEIKTTASDIIADTKKSHRHDSDWFKELWFAIPENLSQNLHIPERAGILLIKNHKNGYYAKAMRPPRINKMAKKWPSEKREKLMQLGIMRIWGLKQTLCDKIMEKK